MIDITLKARDNGELSSCKVSGHAGYAKKGEDIVCAAVSVLVRTAVLQLQEWKKGDEDLKVSLNCQSVGLVVFDITQRGECLHEALIHLFSFLKLGFEGIHLEYSDYVRLQVE